MPRPVYTRTMRGEKELLTEIFGDAYAHYAAHVPAFVPRLTAYRAPAKDDVPGGGFVFGRYLRNKEWEAALGFVAVFTYFVVRWQMAL